MSDLVIIVRRSLTLPSLLVIPIVVLVSPCPPLVHALRLTLYSVLGVRPVILKLVVVSERFIPLGGVPTNIPSDSMGMYSSCNRM